MTLKKSALAVAAAAIIAAPGASLLYAADQTWNGRVHVRLEIDDNDGEGEDISLVNAGHRIGVQGNGDTNGGSQVGYQIELELQGKEGLEDSDGNRIYDTPFASRDGDPFEVRQANAWIGGDWGIVKFGRQSNPHTSVYKSDVFERNSGPFELAPFRLGDAAIYNGSFQNVNLWAGTVIDGQGTDDGEDLDATVIGIEGNFGKSLSIALSNFSTAEDGSAGLDGSITGLGASWAIGGFNIAGWYETESESEIDVFDLGLWYTANNTSFGGGWAHQQFDEPEETIDRLLLGVYHRLGGGADTYIEYGAYSFDETDDADSSNITIGYRVRFN